MIVYMGSSRNFSYRGQQGGAGARAKGKRNRTQSEVITLEEQMVDLRPPDQNV